MAILAAIADEHPRLRSRRLRLAVLVVLLLATYPLALLGHFVVDLAFGDRQMLREIQYGYSRLLADRLLHGWMNSAVPVALLWLALYAVDRLVPGAYPLVALVATATAAILALVTPLPPLVAWLVLAAVLLGSAYRIATRRIAARKP